MVSGSCSSQSHCVLAAACDQRTSFPSDPLGCFPCSTGEAEPSISWRHNECSTLGLLFFSWYVKLSFFLLIAVCLIIRLLGRVYKGKAGGKCHVGFSSPQRGVARQQG